MATEGHASDIEPLCTDSEEAPASPNVGLVNNSVYKESDVLRVLWRLWLALVALSVTCAAVGARYGTCEDGPPTVLYVIFGTLLAAMQVWQFRVAVTHTKLWHEGSRGNCWAALYVFYCGLGCAEIYDFFTDGQQIAQAYLCDGDIHGSWVLSFQQAHSLALPVVERLHMAGIMALCQALAVGLQGAWLRLLAFKADNVSVALASNLVGLGGLEKAFLENREEEYGSIPFFRALLVGLFETLPGLMLQNSLFALTFEHTDQTSRKKQVLSLVITWGTTLKMTMGTLPGLKDVAQKCARR